MGDGQHDSCFQENDWRYALIKKTILDYGNDDQDEGHKQQYSESDSKTEGNDCVELVNNIEDEAATDLVNLAELFI